MTVFICSSHSLYAQEEEKKIIQVSGVVVDEETQSGLPGTHIFIPATRRGTTSNAVGYFSFPAAVGDSIVFSSVGYERLYLIIPDTKKGKITELIEMRPDTTYLRDVEVSPYLTEREFKEAILAMKIPNQEEYANMRRNLSDARLAALFAVTPMDGSENYRFSNQVNFNRVHTNNSVQTIPLLNPFAISSLFESIRRGDFKKKAREGQEDL
ncbi:MAG: carboxypeptidase-like regulatory domain-containing protein [Cyclobacteriaceae bacterium]|nr:carboxypeptidase-like regulatory domain-containing protein [Cyclobacteriaceae bacterium]